METDHSERPIPPVVGMSCSRSTTERLVLLFRQSTFEFTQANLADMLSVRQHSAFGLEVQTLILISNCKRRNVAKFHDLYNQALRALSPIVNADAAKSHQASQFSIEKILDYRFPFKIESGCLPLCTPDRQYKQCRQCSSRDNWREGISRALSRKASRNLYNLQNVDKKHLALLQTSP